MKKRLLASLLTLCMVLSLLPTVAMAATSATVIVGGVTMADGDYLASGGSDTDTTKPTSGGYAYLNNGVLTLHNYSYEGVGHNNAAIYIAGGDLEITLEGVNSVVQSGNSNSSVGIYADGSSYMLTINGDGTLNAGTGAATGTSANSYGIYAGSITIGGDATVNATAGAATKTDDGSAISYGLRAGSGSLTINGSATVNATGGAVSGNKSYGIYAGANAPIIISGGVTVARAGMVGSSYSGTDRYAIYCSTSNGISLDDGKGNTTQIAGAVGYDDSGLTMLVNPGAQQYYIGGTISDTSTTTHATGVVIVPEADNYTVYDSTQTYSSDVTLEANTAIVTATATAIDASSISSIDTGNYRLVAVSLYEGSATDSYGISAGGNINLTLAGNILAIGGTSAFTSSGIYAYGNGTLTLDGDILAIGGTASGTASSTGANSYGIYTRSNFTLTLKGDILALGGTASGTGSVSYGIYAYGNSSAIDITNSTVLAIGGTAAGDSYGIYAFSGSSPSSITINVTPAAGKTINVYAGNTGFDYVGSYTATTDITSSVNELKYFLCYVVATYSYNNPTASAQNGVAATVEFLPASPQAATTIVTATVTLSGTASKAGIHTINLNSTQAGLTGTAQNITVTEGQTTFTGLLTYSFTVPAQNVDDLELTHTFTVQSSSGGTTYYTLTFDTNGGSSISAVTRAAYTSISLSAYIPTREGYTFTGWYSDGELTTEIESVRLTKNTTIYAGWEWVNPFTDVSESDWFYEDVQAIYELGLMQGTSASTFSPHATTTRGMIVTILYRLEGEPGVSDANPFTDVAQAMYYEDAITWAAENGIVGGYGGGLFGPEDAITREQMVTILYNYAVYKGYDVSIGEDTNILSYNDAFDVSSYAYPALQWAVGEGIVHGDGANLMPKGSATRAQVAAILHRFLSVVE